MWRKVLTGVIVLGGTFSTAFVSYNDQINVMTSDHSILATREDDSSGSKFVFGSYEGQEISFEAIQNHVNGGTLATVRNEFVRLGICNLANCESLTSPEYADAALSYVASEESAILDTDRKG